MLVKNILLVVMHSCDESSMISWKSKKQSTIALSSCEAENVALATATQDPKFLRQLFTGM